MKINLSNTFIRSIIVITSGIAIIILLITCDIDPWTRGETSIEVDAKTGKRTEIQTNLVKITKTIEQYRGSAIPAAINSNKASSAPVMLSHKEHSAHGLSCATCHHKAYNPERKKICARCHYGFDGMDTMHRFCLGCHKAEKNGIEKCHQCHK